VHKVHIIFLLRDENVDRKDGRLSTFRLGHLSFLSLLQHEEQNNNDSDEVNEDDNISKTNSSQNNVFRYTKQYGMPTACHGFFIYNSSTAIKVITNVCLVIIYSESRSTLCIFSLIYSQVWK
jgi:hypothetical protein